MCIFWPSPKNSDSPFFKRSRPRSRHTGAVFPSDFPSWQTRDSGMQQMNLAISPGTRRKGKEKEEATMFGALPVPSQQTYEQPTTDKKAEDESLYGYPESEDSACMTRAIGRASAEAGPPSEAGSSVKAGSSKETARCKKNCLVQRTGLVPVADLTLSNLDIHTRSPFLKRLFEVDPEAHAYIQCPSNDPEGSWPQDRMKLILDHDPDNRVPSPPLPRTSDESSYKSPKVEDYTKAIRLPLSEPLNFYENPSGSAIAGPSSEAERDRKKRSPAEEEDAVHVFDLDDILRTAPKGSHRRRRRRKSRISRPPINTSRAQQSRLSQESLENTQPSFG